MESCWHLLGVSSSVIPSLPAFSLISEDEIVGWHHRLNGHEFEQAPGDGEGQGSLAFCSPWVHRVRQNWVTKQHSRRLPENQPVCAVESWNTNSYCPAIPTLLDFLKIRSGLPNLCSLSPLHNCVVLIPWGKSLPAQVTLEWLSLCWVNRVITRLGYRKPGWNWVHRVLPEGTCTSFLNTLKNQFPCL